MQLSVNWAGRWVISSSRRADCRPNWPTTGDCRPAAAAAAARRPPAPPCRRRRDRRDLVGTDAGNRRRSAPAADVLSGQFTYRGVSPAVGHGAASRGAAGPEGTQRRAHTAAPGRGEDSGASPESTAAPGRRAHSGTGLENTAAPPARSTQRRRPGGHTAASTHSGAGPGGHSGASPESTAAPGRRAQRRPRPGAHSGVGPESSTASCRSIAGSLQCMSRKWHVVYTYVTFIVPIHNKILRTAELSRPKDFPMPCAVVYGFVPHTYYNHATPSRTGA